MDYKDYYKIVGVDRDASQQEIKRAYKKLARKYHPDVSKEVDAEALFKALGEAYAVLKDPEKRAAYDELGTNWKAGQEFRPPPDWGNGFEFSGSGTHAADAGAYSDFFESLYGQGIGPQAGPRTRQGFAARGEDHHAKVQVDIEDTYQGASHAISLRTPEADESGHVITKNRTLNVKIPKGVRQGQKIRLSGQGSPGHGNGGAGDLYLEIEFRPHSFYRPDGIDIYVDLPLTPWEAALGATVKVPTPDGPVDMKIPAGTSNDQKLRLKGRGIPGNPSGDIYVVAKLTLPPASSDADKEFYKKMQQDLPYNPRGHLEV